MKGKVTILIDDYNNMIEEKNKLKSEISRLEDGIEKRKAFAFNNFGSSYTFYVIDEERICFMYENKIFELQKRIHELEDENENIKLNLPSKKKKSWFKKWKNT